MDWFFFNEVKPKGPAQIQFLLLASASIFLLQLSCKNQSLEGTNPALAKKKQANPSGDSKNPAAPAAPFSQLPTDDKVNIEFGISGSFLLVEKGQSKTYSNLDSHTLYFIQNKKITDKVVGVVSGNASTQVYFPKASPGPAGSLKPIPEGIYSLEKPESSDIQAIGPWFAPIVPDPSPRGEFGIHLDGNRSSSPGTAGCIGLPDTVSLNKFLVWMKSSSAPGRLVVNWHLGTLKTSGPMLALSQLTDFFESPFANFARERNKYSFGSNKNLVEILN